MDQIFTLNSEDLDLLCHIIDTEEIRSKSPDPRLHDVDSSAKEPLNSPPQLELTEVINESCIYQNLGLCENK